ncbi:MAG: hypothetical protein NT138_27060 [Planctomycetales bacterium]|nr:hypothetical protein [Planctomycetales bacterium]
MPGPQLNAGTAIEAAMDPKALMAVSPPASARVFLANSPND